MRLNLTCKDVDILDQVSVAIQSNVKHAWVTVIAPHARVDLILSSEPDVRVRGPNNRWNELVFQAMFERTGRVVREFVAQNEIWFPAERLGDVEAVLIRACRAMRPRLPLLRLLLASLVLAAASVQAQPSPTGLIPFKVDLARIAGVNFTSSPYIDVANTAFRVNVVAGGAGGGIAQLQVRNSGGTWTDVGFAGGNQNVPVNCVAGCVAGGSFADSSAFTFGTTPVGLSAFVVDDTATNTVAENSAGAARMSTNRIPYFDLSKSLANTNAFLVTGAGGTFPVTGTFWQATQPVSSTQLPAALDGSGFFKVHEQGTATISGTVTANAGTNLNTSALALDATLTNRLPAGSTPANGESNAITTSRLGAYSFIFNGSTWDRWTGAVTGTVTANQGTANATPWNENLAQVAGAAVSTAATGVQKVGTVGNAGAAFDAANNAAEPANVISVGVETIAQGTQPTAATAGNIRRGLASTEGVIYTQEGNSNRFSCVVPSTATVTTQCQAAPGAGLRAYVTSVTLTNAVTTAQSVDVVFGTGAACVTGITALTNKWFWIGATETGLLTATASFQTPLVPTAANAICLRPTAATAFGGTITGFIAP